MTLQPRIIWAVRAAKLAMASYRLRCLNPAIYLHDLGWPSLILDDEQTLESFTPQENDILVIVKDLSYALLTLAKRFRGKGLPVIYDLCDPIFFDEYRGGRDIAGAKFLKDMLVLVDQVTTSSPGIAEGLKSVFNYSKNVPIVKDAALRPVHIARLMAYLKDQNIDPGPRIYPAYPDLKRSTIIWNLLNGQLLPLNFWRLHPGRRRIVWFGKSGGEYDNHKNIAIGFRALCQWKDELIRLNRTVPIELAIMSNSSLKNFRRYFTGWPFPIAYADWSLLGFQKLMQSADLALVPIGTDRIAQCSSGNRITQSLVFKVPVICNKLEGLEPLYPYLGLEGIFQSGKAYLTDQTLRSQHIKGAREILWRRYSPQSIARSWERILQATLNQKQEVK